MQSEISNRYFQMEMYLTTAIFHDHLGIYYYNQVELVQVSFVNWVFLSEQMVNGQSKQSLQSGISACHFHKPLTNRFLRVTIFFYRTCDSPTLLTRYTQAAQIDDTSSYRIRDSWNYLSRYFKPRIQRRVTLETLTVSLRDRKGSRDHIPPASTVSKQSGRGSARRQ